MTQAVERRTDWPSVASLATPLVERLIADAAALRLGIHAGPAGARIVDAGIDAPGGIEAGRRIAEICMGGLGSVAVATDQALARWPVSVTSRSSHPVLACLGSQYAGWNLSVDKYHAMGSGPGRALAAREKLFEELAYRDTADAAVLVLETDKQPPPALVEKVAGDCAVAPERVTLILTPTKSLAGTVQIAARCLEVALHKAHALGFPLDHVVDGFAVAPLPPPAKDFVGAMGRTNDAILYGGRAHLFVRGDEGEAEWLARKLPSAGSRDHGLTFAQVFKAYNGDFFAIDPMLFSPARVIVTALASGRSFSAGAIEPGTIDESFGG
ncbi:MAG: methenyltetrahydromethanopterin cyclohydrolase [Alphaproteobacteria bacterium]|nr:methenyltetrahydromethanopterin cyclohydrolase [Alphaproteobacteria bacterium]